MQYPPPPPPGGLPPPPPPPPPGGYPVDPYYQPLVGPYQGGFSAQPAYAAQVTYGGFWIRFVAAFVDGIIVAVAIFVIFIAIGIIAAVAAMATGRTVDTTAPGTEALSDLISLVISVGYFVYYWGMGQTRAMRWFHLQVVDANTLEPIGFGRALVRYLGYVLSALACYIGLIWAAFDARKQGWHDKIAHTVVIRVA